MSEEALSPDCIPRNHHSRRYQTTNYRRKGVILKLQPKCRGPFLVTEKHNEVLAEVPIFIRKGTTVHADLVGYAE